jgi:tRNA1(Val) A37 N6-methylase TrmN6
MPGCCSAFESAADQQFNHRKVAQELKRYREKGPGPTTRLLADGIAQSGALSGTVLDVGSGIGALTLALLERGAATAIAVDASTAYVDVAREEAGRRGQMDAIQFVHADFVERASQLPSAMSWRSIASSVAIPRGSASSTRRLDMPSDVSRCPILGMRGTSVWE